jgi:two-component system sensor histidine kinase SenX3
VHVSSAGIDEITIAVSDKGIGIAQADQARLFEPFFRLEKEDGSTTLYPGLGIGLTIAKFVMDRHDGRITINSTPDVGSTFTLHLPQK